MKLVPFGQPRVTGKPNTLPSARLHTERLSSVRRVRPAVYQKRRSELQLPEVLQSDGDRLRSSVK